MAGLESERDNHFDDGTDAGKQWMQKQKDKDLHQLKIVYGKPGEVVRPTQKEDFASMKGMKRPGLFEFKAMAQGRVSTRCNQCNCIPCYIWKIARDTTGGATGPVPVPDCERGAANPSLYGWEQRSCAQKDPTTARKARSQAQTWGKANAASLEPSQWVCIVVRNGDGSLSGSSDGVFWLGRAVSARAFLGSDVCVKNSMPELRMVRLEVCVRTGTLASTRVTTLWQSSGTSGSWRTLNGGNSRWAGRASTFSMPPSCVPFC